MVETIKRNDRWTWTGFVTSVQSEYSRYNAYPPQSCPIEEFAGPIEEFAGPIEEFACPIGVFLHSMKERQIGKGFG